MCYLRQTVQDYGLDALRTASSTRRVEETVQAEVYRQPLQALHQGCHRREGVLVSEVADPEQHRRLIGPRALKVLFELEAGAADLASQTISTRFREGIHCLSSRVRS